jgi:hypothetical protein
MVEHHLVTFPRTGSFFLKYLLETNSSIVINKEHDYVASGPNKKIISTIREPQDTLISYITMLCHYRKGFDIDWSIQFLAHSYYKYCKYFINSSDVIVEYDSLVRDPQKTLEKLFNRLDINYNEELILEFKQDDMVEKHHLSSSKSSEWYDVVSDKVLSANLGNAIMYYDRITKSENYLA